MKAFGLTNRLVPLLVAVVAVATVRCADPPPEAPKDLQELCGFLFEHNIDSDQTLLIEGLENLYEWMDGHGAAVRDGHTVFNLSKGAIESTGNTILKDGRLIGAVVAGDSGFDVKAMARALGVDNTLEVNGDAYVAFERTWQGDPECFAQQKCMSVSSDSLSEARWAGLISVKYNSHLEFRWVKTSRGWVMIHRSFLNEKPEVSLSLIDVRQNYWLGVVLPTSKKTGDSRATLLQSNWSDVDYGILPIPESTALNLVVSSMKDSFDATETWMNGHYEKP